MTACRCRSASGSGRAAVAKCAARNIAAPQVAKKEKFFGWRLHPICTPAGAPVSYALLPAHLHDLTPIHELAYVLPPGACLSGDKGYIAASDAATMLARNSQLEKIGVEQLHARTNIGFEIKLHASLLALAVTNFNRQSRYHVSALRRRPA
ncbi:MAG TPA: hypothetical protein VFD58_01845 [Blastocatellia bacterium]|nr:hypothetical protein [Blastocatellia bacterium]